MSKNFNLTHQVLTRLGIEPPMDSSSLKFLKELQQKFFMSTPFENLSLQEIYESDEARHKRYVEIAQGLRGGLCYDSGVVIAEVLDTYGYRYKKVLARVNPSVTTGSTHLIFIVEVEEDEWILDVGYGARGPRGLLKLVGGFEHSDTFLRSRVRNQSSGSSPYRWTVEINENSTSWEEIYSFDNVDVNKQDIEIAYFYTAKHPSSLLNRHTVCSLPIEGGRLSFKDGEFTILTATGKTTQRPDKDTQDKLLNEYFGITVNTKEK